MELCPDAPGDNDLRPGTWTRRHRSQVVSDRKLAKSNFRKDAGDDLKEADLGDFQAYNEVYARHFAEPRPVRTTVEAKLIGAMLVEITVVARRPG